VTSFLFGLFGGFTAWFATDYFLRPLTKFFALRAETAKALALYEEPVDPDHPDVFSLRPSNGRYRKCSPPAASLWEPARVQAPESVSAEPILELNLGHREVVPFSGTEWRLSQGGF
jgi:hypothetical protein